MITNYDIIKTPAAGAERRRIRPRSTRIRSMKRHSDIWQAIAYDALGLAEDGKPLVHYVCHQLPSIEASDPSASQSASLTCISRSFHYFAPRNRRRLHAYPNPFPSRNDDTSFMTTAHFTTMLAFGAFQLALLLRGSSKTMRCSSALAAPNNWHWGVQGR